MLRSNFKDDHRFLWAETDRFFLRSEGNWSKSRYVRGGALAKIMTLSNCINVLLIEDNLAEARLLQEILKGASSHTFIVVAVPRLSEGLQKLTEKIFDVILLDLTLPDSEGLVSLAPLMTVNPSIPIVVLTNHNDDHLALAAVREGAQDYLVKRNANLDSLVRSICYAIERKQTEDKIRRENQFLEKNIQEQTEALNKAQQLNQLKSEFVSMISHDFRNPLNTILLSADLLEESRDKLTAEQQLKFFRMIRSAIKDMDHLLTEVLLLGRADSGKLSCHFVPLDLREFCEGLVASLSVDLETQAMEKESDRLIELSFEGEIGIEMWDKGLLRHILINLLTNAIKYSPLRTKVKFHCQIEEAWVTFRIEDQGIGIPEQALAHLFEPFYRADNVYGINGTGLGLTIVQCCVEVYGGQLQVQSELNQGSIFTVILPRQQTVTTNNVSSEQGRRSLDYVQV